MTTNELIGEVWYQVGKAIWAEQNKREDDARTLLVRLRQLLNDQLSLEVDGDAETQSKGRMKE